MSSYVTTQYEMQYEYSDIAESPGYVPAYANWSAVLLQLNCATDSFLTLITDGVTFSMTNQEVANIILSADTPQAAADQVTDMSIQLGSQDNNTAIVLPLGAWGCHEPIDAELPFELGRTLSPRD